MTIKEEAGYFWMKGALKAVSGQVLFAMFLLFVWYVIRLSLGIGMDDSDSGPWGRSGLTVHTDAKTGIQYLSDGHGGMVRREVK